MTALVVLCAFGKSYVRRPNSPYTHPYIHKQNKESTHISSSSSSSESSATSITAAAASSLARLAASRWQSATCAACFAWSFSPAVGVFGWVVWLGWNGVWMLQTQTQTEKTHC